MCVASVDADDRKLDASELMPKPARHCSSLKADTSAFGARLRSSSVNAACSDLALPSNYPCAIADRAHCSFLL